MKFEQEVKKMEINIKETKKNQFVLKDQSVDFQREEINTRTLEILFPNAHQAIMRQSKLTLIENLEQNKKEKN